MRAVLLAAVALLAACGKEPPKAPPAAAEVVFTAKDGSFSARLPAAWRVDETRLEGSGAAFFGPPDGPRPYSQMITVSFKASTAPPPVGVITDELTLPGPKGALVRLTVRRAAAPAPGGYYALEYSVPAGDEPLPAWDAFRAGFKALR